MEIDLSEDPNRLFLKEILEECKKVQKEILPLVTVKIISASNKEVFSINVTRYYNGKKYDYHHEKIAADLIATIYTDIQKKIDEIEKCLAKTTNN